MTIGKKMSVSLGAMLIATLALGMSSLVAIGSLSHGVVVFTYGKKPDWVQKSSATFQASAQRWTESLSGLELLVANDEGKALLNQLKSGLETWRAMFTEIEQVCAAGNPDAGVQIFIQPGVLLY